MKHLILAMILFIGVEGGAQIPNLGECAELLTNTELLSADAVHQAVEIAAWISFLNPRQLGDGLAQAQSSNELYAFIFSASGHHIPPEPLPTRRFRSRTYTTGELFYRNSISGDEFHQARSKIIDRLPDFSGAFAIELLTSVSDMKIRFNELQQNWVSSGFRITYVLRDELKLWLRTELTVPLEALRKPCVFALVFDFIRNNSTAIVSRHRQLIGLVSENERWPQKIAAIRGVDSKELIERLLAFGRDKRTQIEQQSSARSAVFPLPADFTAVSFSAEPSASIIEPFDWTSVDTFVDMHPPVAITSADSAAFGSLANHLRAAGDLMTEILFAIESGLGPAPPGTRWKALYATAIPDMRGLRNELAKFHAAGAANLALLDRAEGALLKLSDRIDRWNQMVGVIDRGEAALATLNPAQKVNLGSTVTLITGLTQVLESSRRALEQRRVLDLVYLDATAKISVLIGRRLASSIPLVHSEDGDVHHPMILEALEKLAAESP